MGDGQVVSGDGYPKECGGEGKLDGVERCDLRVGLIERWERKQRGERDMEGIEDDGLKLQCRARPER